MSDFEKKYDDYKFKIFIHRLFEVKNKGEKTCQISKKNMTNIFKLLKL